MFILFTLSIIAADLPRALLQMERSRERIVRAEIIWERTDYRGSFVPGVPKLNRSGFTENEVAYFADGTFGSDIVPDGTNGWTEDGDPVPNTRDSMLTGSDGVWSLMTDQFVAQRWNTPKGAPRSPDVRLIGLMPIPNLSMDLAKQLRGDGDAYRREFKEAEVDGIHVVECEFPESGSKYVWHIDPAKDWNCVRSQFIVKDRVIAESLSEYQRSEDGTWFPLSVDYFAADMELLSHIEVTSCRINTPDLPKVLTPEFIGLGPGFLVMRNEPDGSSKPMKYVRDGRLATMDEFLELSRRGEVETDARLGIIEERARRAQAERAAASAALEARANERLATPSSQPVDEWEVYTYEFIRRFELDRDQSQRAVLVLLQCQQRRDAYLKSRESTLADLGKEMLLLPQGDARASAERRLAALRRPIEEIFERQLKPRLEKLPTRKQRDALGGPASQPVNTDKR